MIKNTLTTLFVIVFVFLLSFFIWHFFLSIYEVKIETSVRGTILKSNSELTIKTIGINSLGWELPFRKIKSKVEILEGDELIELFQYENTINIKTLNKKGELILKVTPKLSLNSTRILYKVLSSK